MRYANTVPKYQAQTDAQMKPPNFIKSEKTEKKQVKKTPNKARRKNGNELMHEYIE